MRVAHPGHRHDRVSRRERLGHRVRQRGYPASALPGLVPGACRGPGHSAPRLKWRNEQPEPEGRTWRDAAGLALTVVGDAMNDAVRTGRVMRAMRASSSDP